MVLAVSRPRTSGLGITWDLVWVGDCQAWLVDDNQLTPLTTPHTQGQWMRDLGMPENVAAGSDNIVLTTVGTADPSEFGTTTTTTASGRLALTSDGVGMTLKPAELLETLSQIDSPQRCAQRLVELGAAHPTADNSTALVIDTRA
ncbi:hypothetical protein [Alloactinosynnema sp. L-07]|uniref:PP2C family protein-serine/threonine phosphatase n=1 Tax=Alloactinosynnema sp. L-07 TaxID=1653480 RepID=UPI00065F02DC|nr:hypothetical protein [Alloactinosynnema sp. L-07]CRK56891.1 hypothetical protein [Alloactinosynnema sp. L-07]